MHTLYISTLSPYSLKASALIGYSGFPARVVKQNVVNRFLVLKRLTGRTMVPVLRDGEWAINDSTRIAEYVIARSERRFLPRDASLAPLCWFLEDFADEWIMRWMLLSRWHNRRDSQTSAQFIGEELLSALPVAGDAVGRVAGHQIKTLIARAGIRASNAPALTRSRDRLLVALEDLLSQPPLYLFEGYPTVADFALYGQLVQFCRDPSGQQMMRAFPAVRDYVERIDAMCLPVPELALGTGAVSRPAAALLPLFAEFMGTYWPLLEANFRACAREERPRSTRARLIDGTTYVFEPGSYLVGRLRQLLARIDETYREQDDLFGREGLRLESAMMAHVAGLSRHTEGRELLRDYPHLGLH